MKESRPNILLIMTDNQSADFLGCYGNHEVKTPNIDFLSEEGKNLLLHIVQMQCVLLVGHLC